MSNVASLPGQGHSAPPAEPGQGRAIVACLTGATLLGVVDWWTGNELNFFVFYFAPIAWLAWRARPAAAAGLAVFSALVWAAADQAAGASYRHDLFAIWNTMIRLAAFLGVVWAVDVARRSLARERTARAQLERTLSELRVLRGLLSICAECKKIKNEDGVWQPVETYVVQHSDALFSHGFCPVCARRALADAGMVAPRPDDRLGPRLIGPR